MFTSIPCSARVRFLLGLVCICVGPPCHLVAAPVINEFVASNSFGLKDEDGDYSDWIEVFNPDVAAVNLEGWAITDTASNKTKWRFPSVSIAPGEYLVVSASGKNRATAGTPLHTSFKLGAGGDYLALVQADGVTVASEYSPEYPAQITDVSYGWTQPTDVSETAIRSYLSPATPGARNGSAFSPPLKETVNFSRDSGPFTSVFELVLGGADDGQVIRYVMATPSAEDGSNPGAPTSSSFEYTGPLSIDSSVIVRAAVFTADGARSGGVTTAHYLQLDPGADFISQLPILVLDNHGFGNLVVGASKKPAWMHLFVPDGSGVSRLDGAPALSSPVNTKIRGFSSAQFPKKSYNLELLSNTRSKQAQSLLGLTADVDWAIVSPWYFDRANLRNAYLYELSRQIGRWAPATRFVELFFNVDGNRLDRNDYRGISVLTERVQIAPHRVAIRSLSPGHTSAPEISGGYLMKIDSNDPDEYGWQTTRGNPPAGFGSVIVLADPKLDDLPDPQRDYIRDYVQSMEDALIADQNANWATRNYLNYLDRAAWVDYHILINLSKTADGMQRSSFLYKDRGDRLKAGPLWDLDRSMHSYDHAQRDGDWASWTNIEGDTLWTYSWWGVLTRDPDYRQDWVDRWQTLRLTTFANDHLTRLADDLAAEIGPEAFARDAARWELGSSFSSEMDRVKNWLVQRSGWIDSQFVAAPHLAREGDRIRVTPPAGASVVYTTDGTDPRLSGGGIASHATILTGPALLNESDAVRLRSYDAAQVNSYPGSPWSRAVLLSSASSGGPASINLFDGHASARSGETVTIGPDGDFRSGLSFEWHYNSVRIPGAAEPRLKLDAAAPSQSGIYVLTVRENGIQVGTAQYTVNISVFANLVNLSARAEVGSGNDVLIGGFVVRGAGTKNFLVRAVGPSLREQGIATPLAAPTLRVYKADGSIHASNTGWLTSPDATEIATAAARVGAFALSSHGLDSALLLRVPGGIYTLHVGGASGQGIGLAEIYALDENSSPLNLSARARVAADDGLLIGGLVIDGHDHKRVLIRAVGPTLAEHGLANELLLDPEFQVLSRAVPLYANDNWSDAANAAEIASTAAAVGAFPLRQGSADAALVVDLAPGAYTVLVRGKNRTEGIALVEIYSVD